MALISIPDIIICLHCIRHSKTNFRCHVVLIVPTIPEFSSNPFQIVILILIAKEISFAISGWATSLFSVALRPYPWNLCRLFPLMTAKVTARAPTAMAIAREIVILVSVANESIIISGGWFLCLCFYLT